MNRIIKNTVKVIAVILLIAGSYSVSAQPSLPPTGSDGGGNQGNKLGGKAPIGGGLFMLLGLGAAYGGRKLYQLKTIDT